jgi:hypothetical protein
MLMVFLARAAAVLPPFFWSMNERALSIACCWLISAAVRAMLIISSHRIEYIFFII